MLSSNMHNMRPPGIGGDVACNDGLCPPAATGSPRAVVWRSDSVLQGDRPVVHEANVAGRMRGRWAQWRRS